MSQPLLGLNVLDLTRLLPGPVCTWHLASMGARVIKIEDKDQGDYARFFFQTVEDIARDEPSVFYRALNANKEVLRLDLKCEEDKQTFTERVLEADLVIESFRPGVMERLGLGAASLLALKPSLVVCSITGYGLSGEWRNKACHDLNSLAMTGVLDQMRDASGVPIIPNLQFADLLGGGVSAAMGCLAALWGAQRSKQGCIVDVSMTDGILAHNLTAQVAVHHLGATKGPNEDLLNGGVPCYNLYRTQDHEWLALGALELKFWQQFCETLGRSEWANMHWSLGQGIGSKEALELKAQVQSVVAAHTLQHWLDQFSQVDCCLTPVLTLKEAMEHPLFRERAMFEIDPKGMRWLKSPLQFIEPH